MTPQFFVAPDSHNEPTIWTGDPEDAASIALLSKWKIFRGFRFNDISGDRLWDLIVSAVDGSLEAAAEKRGAARATDVLAQIGRLVEATLDDEDPFRRQYALEEIAQVLAGVEVS
jgi:hypothetical protein